MLITRAELAGEGPVDVRIARGRIAEIAAHLDPREGEPRLDARGGALLPGLHDHHVHIFALARAASSLPCGPPDVRSAADLARALAGAPAGEDWLRGVGYHESVAGALDRGRLDALAPRRPVRIQHRSGALWMLNSAAVERLGLDRGADAPGVERDPAGRATGRLFRLDAWLRERLDDAPPPDLRALGCRLASFGLTGLTDTTPTNGPEELALFRAAARRGELRQRLVVMGTLELPAPPTGEIERGALKLLLRDDALPDPDALAGTVAEAHAGGRSVAVHCVTRAELVLATSAFAEAGCVAGDRIEHASVTPPDLLERVAQLGLTVVTQPHFVCERGDAYATDVDARDRPWLYRARAFLDAGIPLGGGTDAPFGHPDPWRAMRAAVERRTETGLRLGPEERLSPEQALALFTSPPERPGAPPRPLRVGSPADLCLLDRPWSAARTDLTSDRVAATLRAGTPTYRREPASGT